MTMTEYNFFFAALILFLLINLIGRLENIPQIILNVNEITKSFSLFVILLTRALFALNTNKITFKTKTKETSMRQILCFFFFCLWKLALYEQTRGLKNNDHTILPLVFGSVHAFAFELFDFYPMTLENERKVTVRHVNTHTNNNVINNKFYASSIISARWNHAYHKIGAQSFPSFLSSLYFITYTSIVGISIISVSSNFQYKYVSLFSQKYKRRFFVLRL